MNQRGWRGAGDNGQGGRWGVGTDPSLYPGPRNRDIFETQIISQCAIGEYSPERVIRSGFKKFLVCGHATQTVFIAECFQLLGVSWGSDEYLR